MANDAQTTPLIDTSIFIPWCAGAPAGMSDWCPKMPLRRFDCASESRGVGRGPRNVVRSKTSRGEGLVPRWGGGGAWQNPPRQLAVPSHNSSFSYLGVPAPAGMSDCCESTSRTPIRDRPLRQTLIGRSRHPFVYPAPHFVTPAKAGVQG